VGEALAKTHLLTTGFSAMAATVQDWQTKLLNKWREDRRKTPQQRQADLEEYAAKQEAERFAADERFYASYPHLRPTAERLAALKKGECAFCNARYPAWEHFAHFYCSMGCARKEASASAASAAAAK